MEENLIEYMQQVFTFGNVDLKTYSPLTLAYIGDGVYDLIIRSVMVNKGNCPVKSLHKQTSRLVNAGTQSAMIEVMKEQLTEEEKAVYKRGRNAFSHSRAKNASMTEYRRATGFEALIGYLYLKGSYKRMTDLIKAGLQGIGEEL